jgi:nucleoredoxin
VGLAVLAIRVTIGVDPGDYERAISSRFTTDVGNKMHRLRGGIRLFSAAAAAAVPLSLYVPVVECKASSGLFPPGAKLERKGAAFAEEASSSLGEESHVLLYFSARWCPPCRRFTPILKEFYEVANRGGKKLEVVFVSSDETGDAAQTYLREAHGDWLMVPFDAPLRWDMKKRYGVWAGAEREVMGTDGKRTGVPTLVLVDAETGEELDFMAKEKVQEAVDKGGDVRVDACLHSFAAQAALCRRMRAEEAARSP